jgi:2-(1,2-epoxy-1,2-dihydrophenyl)acetyl-CoA isomerase
MSAISDFVLWRVEDGVGHITLNRPDAANAMNADAARQLAAVIDVACKADIGAVLLSSTGKQFCAGGDINEFVARRHALEGLIREILDLMHPALHRLVTLPLPVLSAVHAPIGGAGISMALCADIVLASTAMKLRGGYSAIGLSPDLGASYYLSRRAGAAKAKYILMTNKVIPAEECLRLGLVDELHAPDQLLPAATQLAVELARGATGSLGGIKRLCNDAATLDLHTHLERERQALLRCARSADGQEGITAFVEKRAPRFSDARLD